MKHSRAVHHVETLAATCADMVTRPASIFRLGVVEAWVAGAVLGPPAEVEVVLAALVVDLPVDETPWLVPPQGAQHWLQATRLDRQPVSVRWRSAAAPVWNHELDRPVLVWDRTGGTREDVLAALREGRGEALRPPPPDPAALRDRLEAEAAVSLTALRSATATYTERRYTPGTLTPVADALWQATTGYVDVLDARAALAPRR